ncbi:MAG: U32 family peptidase [Clostridiales bacterium]|nr:U32 family peptidase [Clostridiales bacterium]
MQETAVPLELLSPAGDIERLKAAVLFGADAVYLAGREFGMRTAPSNFSGDELCHAVRFAHDAGVKVYLTCNTLPRNDELPRLPAFLEQAEHSGVDALIVSDMGVLAMAKRYAPHTDIHMSTQTGIVNYAAASALYEMGASRVVVARELSLEEIAEIRAKTPQELEIEAFVHGAMCMSFSGRCLISNFLTGRDANRGDCAQPCRWKYMLSEEKRPGQYFPIEETADGTHLLNAQDLCMIDYIPQLRAAGITSLKIEGRAKSSYYVSVVTAAYRAAIRHYEQNGWSSLLPEWISAEVQKVSHRAYSTGFYFGEPSQNHQDGGYIRSYEVIAVVEGYEDGRLLLSQRNHFRAGETADVLCPGQEPFYMTMDEMQNGEGEPIDVAPHPTMRVTVPFDRPLPKGSLLRRQAR